MRKSFVTVIVAALIGIAAPVLAHHASQAEFDKNSPKTIHVGAGFSRPALR